MATPFPTAPDAKTASSIESKGKTVPWIGAYNSIS